MLYDKRWDAKENKTKTNLQPWRVILLLAADELETNGWCQQEWQWGYARCALGAIRHVGGSHAARVEAETQLGRHLNNLPIVCWNDYPSRTKEEVVAKLREVATAKIKI